VDFAMPLGLTFFSFFIKLPDSIFVLESVPFSDFFLDYFSNLGLSSLLSSFFYFFTLTSFTSIVPVLALIALFGYYYLSLLSSASRI